MLNKRGVFSVFKKGAWESAVCFLMYLAGSAQGAPAIQSTSGSFSHKTTVTINGTGFGTKGTAAPVVWDDASGANILDKWNLAWPNNNPTYNTAYRSPMRGISLPHNNITRYIAGAHGDSTGANAGTILAICKFRTISSYPAYTYASWYERADDNWVFGQDNNYKTFAFSTGQGPYNEPAAWYLAFNPPTPGDRTASTVYVFGGDAWSPNYPYPQPTILDPDMNGHSHWWGNAINPMSGVWKKVEMELKYTNQTDGYVKLWENGVLRINYAGSTDRYPGTDRTDCLGGYARMYGQPNNWRYFADVYLDYSRARVVLANNASLTSSTVIEPQIPSSWSAGSINVSVNLGRFTTGQTAYLFVFDPTGVPNATGFPITVGSGAGGVRLPPPSNLRVQ